MLLFQEAVSPVLDFNSLVSDIFYLLIILRLSKAVVPVVILHI